ncbi:hypothetical protein AGOR_G00149070 [Albula goreensis]|uniref:Amine oxidase domain-containing protein n=1 Tax=Albula goreensis TaxID=1534307 RepID=A0A8T3DAS2_9TELE|nr:hypothetical protein AGOR_G00149070 [Albula goreensis]
MFTVYPERRKYQVSGTQTVLKISSSETMVSMMKSDPKILVVGAGIAGIAAATKLREFGFSDVTLLEATGQTGGRIAKSHLGKSWIDTGAQIIHGATDKNPVYCLCKTHGFLDEVTKEEGSWAIFNNKGNKVDPEFAEQVYEAGQTIMRQMSYDNIKKSIGAHFAEKTQELLSAHEESPNVEQARGILSMVGKDFLIDIGATDLNDVSQASWKYMPKDIGEDLNIGGNMFRLVEKLLEDFPKECVVLNKAVSRIEWDRDDTQYPVRVVLGSEKMEADHVVVTMSLGCLKAGATTLFSPQLPQDKVQVINDLQFGTITKIFLEYEEAFWESSVSEISLVWEDESCEHIFTERNNWLKYLHDFTVMRPQEKFGNVLIGWCAGDVAKLVEEMSEEKLSAAVTDHLRTFTGNSSLPAPKTVLVTKWQSNPYTMGSYSFIPVGIDAEVMDTLAQPLSSGRDTGPELQVLFAGEGTIKSMYSTVQGALLSGQREANRLAQHYKKTQLPNPTCSITPQDPSPQQMVTHIM